MKWWPKLFLFLALPASTNYQLQGFGMGAGGGANMTSSNYSVHAMTGEESGGMLSGDNYALGSGLVYAQTAHVPPAPTFDNPANYYNKLRVVVNTGNNPADTVFALAISTDNFVSTNYVQNDQTIGPTLGSEDYQTYAAWGGASGAFIIGLAPNTTYKLKVKAMQGKFSESSYGPVATASTVTPNLSFDIDVSASDANTDPPFSTNLGDLVAGAVTSSPEKIWVDVDTNGESGGRVYIAASNGGLSSARASYTIDAVTGNLTSLSEGFGVQGSTATQTSGNTFSIAPAYNLSSNNVGVTDTVIREIFTTSGPVTGGRGSFLLKAKSSAVTPAASDYTETLTVIVSANF